MPDTDRLINKAQGDDIITALNGITSRLQEMYAVDDELSSTSEHPVQNKVVKEALDNKADESDLADKADKSDIASTQTISGNPITLTDAAPINAESLVVEFEPKQDLHGYNFPWTGGAGKNKLPMTVEGIKAANTSGSWSGNVYSINNGTFTILTDNDGNVTGIKVNGTFNATTIVRVSSDIPLTQGGAYKLNGCTTDTNNCRLDLTGNTSGSESYVNIDGDTSFTAGQSSFRMSIIVNSGYQASDIMLYPMIRLATETDPTFAPYSNICPITGYTECEVDDVGFNQWDEEWEVGLLSADGTVNPAFTDRRTTGYIRVQPNTEYYQLSPNGAYAGRIAYYDANKNLVFYDGNGIQSSTKKFTTGNGVYFVRISFGSSYGTTYNHDICINISKTEGTPKNGDYVPYHSSNATIQFGQTVYGSKSDFVEGGTSDEMGMVEYDGSSDEQWSLISVTEGNLFRIALSGRKSGVLATEVSAYCNEFPIVDYNARSNNTLSGGATNIDIIKNDITSVADFKTWLASNNLQVCYEKATASSISTPPTELKLLKGTNHITTNGTTINLGYQPDNVIGEVKGEIEQHLEMPWVKVIIEGEQDDFNEILLEDGGNIIQFPLADNEIYKHRFLLFEVYTTLLGFPMLLCGNAMLSTQTLIELEGGAYIPLSIGNLTDGIIARVYVSITSDYEIQVQLESTASSPITNLYSRARLVD